MPPKQMRQKTKILRLSQATHSKEFAGYDRIYLAYEGNHKTWELQNNA